MSFFGQGWRSCPPASSQRPDLQQTLEATAADLAKQAKIKLGSEAVAMKQLKELADKELRDVAALQAKHLGPHFQPGHNSGADDVGDFIICDDYRRNDVPHGSPMLGKLTSAALLLAGALGGAVAGPSLWYLATRSSSSASSTTTRTIEPQEFEVKWWIQDGKLEKEIRKLP